MTEKRINGITAVLSVVTAIIFLQTLFFKFTNSPETQHIFETFGTWAEGFGFGWFFSRTGPGGPYASGVTELIASLLLLVGTFKPEWRRLQVFGALMTIAIMSVAILLHLITPLGVVVQGDGGFLFALATTALVSGIVTAVLRRELLPFSKKA